jgi:hypothetical protein
LISWEAASGVTSLVALAGVLGTIAAGIARHRIWPVALFSALWFASASYVILGQLATRRRAARQRTGQVPFDVRLNRPLWIPFVDACRFLAVAGPLGALAAIIGYPSVGTGIVLALGLMGLATIAPVGSAAGLTFESTGLRVHGRRGQFFVPWTSVIEVELSAPSPNPSTNLHVAGPQQILSSLTPDTPRNRQGAELLFHLGNPRGQALRFWNWTAGLDSASLVRAVREATGERERIAN